jgi:hypothetical protein
MSAKILYATSFLRTVSTDQCIAEDFVASEPITHSTAKSLICEEIGAVLKCPNSRSPIKMNIWTFYLAIEKTNYTDEI